jgi:hypothetical protein
MVQARVHVLEVSRQNWFSHIIGADSEKPVAVLPVAIGFGHSLGHEWNCIDAAVAGIAAFAGTLPLEPAFDCEVRDAKVIDVCGGTERHVVVGAIEEKPTRSSPYGRHE